MLNHYAFAAVPLVALADVRGANMFIQLVLKQLLNEAVNDTVSGDFNLDKITGGKASKLLLTASAAGHIMKLNFLSLSVFWYSNVTPAKASKKQLQCNNAMALLLNLV